jgi:hypothetical protein
MRVGRHKGGSRIATKLGLTTTKAQQHTHNAESKPESGAEEIKSNACDVRHDGQQGQFQQQILLRKATTITSNDESEGIGQEHESPDGEGAKRSKPQHLEEVEEPWRIDTLSITDEKLPFQVIEIEDLRALQNDIRRTSPFAGQGTNISSISGNSYTIVSEDGQDDDIVSWISWETVSEAGCWYADYSGPCGWTKVVGECFFEALCVAEAVPESDKKDAEAVLRTVPEVDMSLKRNLSTLGEEIQAFMHDPMLMNAEEEVRSNFDDLAVPDTVVLASIPSKLSKFSKGTYATDGGMGVLLGLQDPREVGIMEEENDERRVSKQNGSAPPRIADNSRDLRAGDGQVMEQRQQCDGVGRRISSPSTAMSKRKRKSIVKKMVFAVSFSIPLLARKLRGESARKSAALEANISDYTSSSPSLSISTATSKRKRKSIVKQMGFAASFSLALLARKLRGESARKSAALEANISDDTSFDIKDYAIEKTDSYQPRGINASPSKAESSFDIRDYVSDKRLQQLMGRKSPDLKDMPLDDTGKPMRFQGENRPKTKTKDAANLALSSSEESDFDIRDYLIDPKKAGLSQRSSMDSSFDIRDYIVNPANPQARYFVAQSALRVDAHGSIAHESCVTRQHSNRRTPEGDNIRQKRKVFFKKRLFKKKRDIRSVDSDDKEDVKNANKRKDMATKAKKASRAASAILIGMKRKARGSKVPLVIRKMQSESDASDITMIPRDFTEVQLKHCTSRGESVRGFTKEQVTASSNVGLNSDGFEIVAAAYP